MVGLSGLEKFSHLEDKIYIRREVGGLHSEKERLETQVERLLAERDTIRMKVEAMLDAIAAIDPDMAEVARR